jgi:hypothetical protein
MRGVISVGLIALYILIGWVLEGRAWFHMQSFKRALWHSVPLSDAKNFDEEGKLHHKRALRFYLIGGLVLAVALAVVNLL